MGWTCKTHNTVSPGAPDTESQALDYRIEWTMNNPATATVLVNDDSGAKSQTYGTGYLGKSYLAIEQPTATQIFRGRIVAAEPNPRDGILTLQAEDWLSQLADRLVIFDTREDLGNGYREYPATPFLMHGLTRAWHQEGLNFTLSIPSTDVGSWTADQWNGAAGTHYVVTPSNHLGRQVETLFAEAETTTSSSAPFTTDTPVDGETYTWVEDGNYHSLADTVAASGSIYVDYDFHTLCSASTCVAQIDKLTVHLVARAYGAAALTYRIYLYDHSAGVWEQLGYNPSGSVPEAEKHKYSWEAQKASTDTFEGYFDANGLTHIRVHLLATGAGGALNLDIDEVYITLNYTVDTAQTKVHTITDTVHDPHGTAEPHENQVYFASDYDEVVDFWPFSISRVATIYIADLVTTYDELFTLDASTDVTASTNVIARHFHRMTPLAILRELAKADGTDFWLDAAYHVHWNDTYPVAGAPTWSDPGLGGTYEVLNWEPAGVRLKDIINECFVEGYMVDENYKVMDDYSDAGSIASYGQRSEYVNNPDIGRNDEALAEATNRVKRKKDPPILVTAVLNGYNTRALGEVVIVHSDKLNIQSVDYVITRKVYDSASATTLCDLVPRPTASPYTVNPRVPLTQLMQRIDERVGHLESRLERPSRYTEVWT